MGLTEGFFFFGCLEFFSREKTLRSCRGRKDGEMEGCKEAQLSVYRGYKLRVVI